MRRRRLALAVVLGAALVASPARAADVPALAQAAGAKFPDRTYVLTLPRAVAVATVDVRENGRRMPAVDVQSADGAAGHGFGVVLAVDTSGSMHGRALHSAVAAARAFVSHRSPQQPVALVAFGGEVRVVLPFSTDEAAIDAALGSIADGSFRAMAPSGAPAAPGRAGGSRMLDAAARSVQLVQADHQPAGSIVLLTDGADQGSSTTVDRVAALATGGTIRIYTIGLRTSTSDFGTLNRLAAATHAEFSEAGSLGDLARIYGRLGSRLANQYVIRYRSPAAPSQHVRVDVRVGGFPGVASTSYVTPAAPSRHSAPFHHSPAETLWLRPGAAVGVSVLAVALLAIALWVALRPRGRSLRARMSVYVGLPEPEPDRVRALTAAVRSGKSASRRLDGAAWMADLREQLDVGRIDVPAERLVGWVAATMLAALVLLPLTSGVPATALLALGVPLGARAYVNHCVRKQRRLFTEQLPDNLQVMASAMRAGHSFAGSLAVVSEEAPEPARSEFKRVLADERLGVPVDQALQIAVRRMESKELEQVALVAALQRETGGNTAEVLERVTDTVRERVAVRRLVKTLTAQGRLSRWVLSAIPVVLLAFITVSNPDYVRPLYTTPIGHGLLLVALVMVVTGSLIIKRIIDIKV